MALTREEYAAWAASLKPGDRVAMVDWGGKCREILTVTKRKARVVCGDKQFHVTRWSHVLRLYGFGNGHLDPVTPEREAEAVAYAEEIRLMNERKRIEAEAAKLRGELRAKAESMLWRASSEALAAVCKLLEEDAAKKDAA